MFTGWRFLVPGYRRLHCFCLRCFRCENPGHFKTLNVNVIEVIEILYLMLMLCDNIHLSPNRSQSQQGSLLNVSAISILIAISPDPHPSQTGRFTLGWLYPLLHSLAKVECFILVSRLNDNRWFSRCQMHKSCLEIGTNLIQNVFCSVLLQMDNATAETVRW